MIKYITVARGKTNTEFLEYRKMITSNAQKKKKRKKSNSLR